MLEDIETFLNIFRRDILLLLGMLISLFTKRSREFIRNWGPFMILWIIYDMFRGVADELGPVNIKEVYDLELLLFGWAFNGQIPAFWLQDHQSIIVSSIVAVIYTLHPMIPLWLGIIIFYVSKDVEMFRQFTYSFLLTTYLALLTFIVYPVAPPWYVAENGYSQPSRRTGLEESAGGLINVDNFFNTEFYGTFYATFNSNPFAAMPSLHSSFAVISAIFFIRKYRNKSKLVYLSILYPISVWFSAVYLLHHYIIDLIAGAIYVFVSTYFVYKYRKWKVYDANKENNEIVDINEIEDIGNAQPINQDKDKANVEIVLQDEFGQENNED